MTLRGRPPTSLASAIDTGIRLRPLACARGDYLTGPDSRHVGGSVLLAAAEGAARGLCDPARPAAVLALLKRFPLLDRLAVCPVCQVPARMDEVLELHLNDEHGWSRAQCRGFIWKIERAEYMAKYAAKRREGA